MATVFYPAIIERGRRGYGVFFPDLPGCTSAGDTVTEAALNAEEALAGHLLVSEEYGEALADPSELDAIPRDPEVDEVARLLVRGERVVELGRADLRPQMRRKGLFAEAEVTP